MLKFLAAVLATLTLATPSLLAFRIPDSSTQLILGVAPNWDSSHVTLTLFERRDGSWQRVANPWQGRLGRNGLIWGTGIHPVPVGTKTKSEGDGRAPAGVFHLGGAWGYAPKIQRHPKLPYRQVTTRDLWVEDPASPSYNRHIILDREPNTPWEIKQQMRQGDYPHSLKLFIAHNAPPNVQPGAGSAIFFHIWRDGGTRPSAGCTTMPEDRLRFLIARIDPARRPLYVLLTAADYQRLRQPWGLP